MENVIAFRRPSHWPRWREIVWPREHGSWSLALEPLALGLLVAPSLAGAALAVAAIAGFFARRPLRIAFADANPERRAAGRGAIIVCGAIAVLASLAAIGLAGTAWLPWLLPTAVAGAAFLYFDLHQHGREQHAEIAGAAAFAWLSATLAALAGWTPGAAAALGVVMLVRAVPTVMTVRATIRARKTGTYRVAIPLLTAVMAAAIVALLVHLRLAPWAASILAGLLALRSFALLSYPRFTLRASTIGMIEAGLGVVYIVALGLAWSA